MSSEVSWRYTLSHRADAALKLNGRVCSETSPPSENLRRERDEASTWRCSIRGRKSDDSDDRGSRARIDSPLVRSSFQCRLRLRCLSVFQRGSRDEERRGRGEREGNEGREMKIDEKR